MPAEVSKKDTVLAVQPVLLLQLWENWRRQGHESFDMASEAQVGRLWCSVAQGSECNGTHIAKCLAKVRRSLEKDTTLKAKVLEDGSMEARFDRWLYFILIACSTREVCAKVEELSRMLQFNSASLQEADAEADPEVLHKLHLEFAAQDIDRNRRWRMEDLLKTYYEALSVADQASSDPSATSFVSRMLAGLGLHSDEALTYPEFLSFFLGRVESDVVLCMYDLSKGAAQVVKYAEGIWHTSVEVFGYEYLYGGRCVFVDPGESQFGTCTKKHFVGSTLSRRSELHNFCCKHLSSTFNEGSYHLLQNNCNHFCDKLLRFLCGAKVPDKVIHQADGLLNLPGVQSLWPAVTNLINTRGSPDDIVSESMSRETTELGPSRKLEVFPHPRSDDASSSTTAATEIGGDISTSLGDTDSGMDLPTTRTTAQHSDPVVVRSLGMSPSLHQLQQSMEEDVRDMEGNKGKVPTTRFAPFFKNPFTVRRT